MTSFGLVAIWLVTLVFAWLICYWRGYNAPRLGLSRSALSALAFFVGAENTTHGKFEVPFPIEPSSSASHAPHRRHDKAALVEAARGLSGGSENVDRCMRHVRRAICP